MSLNRGNNKNRISKRVSRIGVVVSSLRDGGLEISKAA
jgi:hypothetical protein